jgi:hypothetical protein
VIFQQVLNLFDIDEIGKREVGQGILRLFCKASNVRRET